MLLAACAVFETVAVAMSKLDYVSVYDSGLTLKRNINHNANISSIAMACLSPKLYFGDVLGALVKVDLAEPSQAPLVKKLDGSVGAISCIDVFASGELLACGTADRSILILRTDTLALHQTFTGHEGAITGLAVFNVDSHIVSGSSDKTLRMWRLADSAISKATLSAAITCLAVSTDGARLACGTEQQVQLWRIASMSLEHLRNVKCSASITCVRFGSGSHRIFAGVWGSGLHEIDMTLGNADRLVVSYDGAVSCATFGMH